MVKDLAVESGLGGTNLSLGFEVIIRLVGEGRGSMGLVCRTEYLWCSLICPVVILGSISFSRWKFVPPKHLAWRFLTTNALS
jgi:hypothetical protein